MVKHYIVLVVFLLSSFLTWAKLSPQDYIKLYSEDAVKEMHRSKVPASITLAQGMLESSYGNSELAVKAKNHFGIKCHNDWDGPTFHKDDDKRDECFRVYESVWHSYRDHSEFLRGKKRYAHLFELKITDYKGWAKGLRKAGYATNPKYAKLLIELIERYELNKYDDPEVSKELIAQNENEKDKETSRGSQKTYSSKKKIAVKVSDNWIKYVEVKDGYTFYKISKETGISLKRLYKYNECDESRKLNLGDKIYLQPKKRKGKQKVHNVKEGETLYEISQKHGIKLKHLCKRNNISLSYVPKPGEKLLLRGRKKN